MRRTLLAVVSIVASTVLLCFVIATDDSWAGRVVWRVTRTHGLHIGDIPVLALWLVGVLATVANAVGPRRPVGQPHPPSPSRPTEQRPVVHD